MLVGKENGQLYPILASTSGFGEMAYALLILILIGAVAAAAGLTIASLRLLRVRSARLRVMAPLITGGVCLGGLCMQPAAFIPLTALLIVASIPLFIVSVLVWFAKRDRIE